MKNCPNCQSSLPDEARFCSSCGYRFEETVPAPETPAAPELSRVKEAKPRRVSPLPFIGFGLAVLGCILGASRGLAMVLGAVGIVISIIGCRKRNKLYGFAVAGIPVGVLAIVIAFCFVLINAGLEQSREAVDTANARAEYAEAAADALADPSDDNLERVEQAAEALDEPADVTIEEQVLVDQDGVKITATGMESGIFGPELNLLIENTSDADLTVQVRNASVNGFMADTMMSEEVAAGKSSNTEITFTTNGLEACGIETFTDMEFSFHVFYTEDWSDYFDTDAIRVETSAYGNYTQTVDDSGTVFYDQDGIKIVGKGLSADDSIFGPGLILYIENNSDTDFTVQVRDTSVNGFMVDTSMSQDVIVGKKAITDVTFFSSSLEENGITQIDSIETSFHVFDMNTWDTIVDTEPIAITF